MRGGVKQGRWWGGMNGVREALDRTAQPHCRHTTPPGHHPCPSFPIQVTPTFTPNHASPAAALSHQLRPLLLHWRMKEQEEELQKHRLLLFLWKKVPSHPFQWARITQTAEVNLLEHCRSDACTQSAKDHLGQVRSCCLKTGHESQPLD